MNSKVVLLIILLIIIIISSIGAYFLLNKKKSSGTPSTSVNTPSVSDDIATPPTTSDTPITTPPITTPPITSSPSLPPGTGVGGGITNPDAFIGGDDTVVTQQNNAMACQAQNQPVSFCKMPAKYVKKCGPFTFVPSELASGYSRKMKDCLKDRITETDKASYEEARNFLLEKDPNVDIPPFPKLIIDCKAVDNSPSTFCDNPKDILESCGWIDNKDKYSCNINGTPLNVSKNVNDKSDTFVVGGNTYNYKSDCTLKGNANIDKLLVCLDPVYNTDKEKYNDARDALIEMNPEYENFIPPFPSVNCNAEQNISYFCKEPSTYIEECRAINKTTDTTYIDNLKKCLTSQYSGIITENEYNKARDLLILNNKNNENEIPEYTEIDCITNSMLLDSNLCKLNKPYDVITQCSNSYGITNRQYANALLECFPPTSRAKGRGNGLSKEDWDNARNELISRDASLSAILPEYTSLDCKERKTTSSADAFCAIPNRYIKECETQDKANNANYNTVLEKYKDDLIQCGKKPELASTIIKENWDEAKRILTQKGFTIPEVDDLKFCYDYYRTEQPMKNLLLKSDNYEGICRNPYEYITRCDGVDPNYLTNKREFETYLNECLSYGVKHATVKANPSSFVEAVKYMKSLYPDIKLSETIPDRPCKSTLFDTVPGYVPDFFNLDTVKGCENTTTKYGMQFNDKVVKTLKEIRDDPIIRRRKDVYQSIKDYLVSEKGYSASSIQSIPEVECREDDPNLCKKPYEYITQCPVEGTEKDLMYWINVLDDENGKCNRDNSIRKGVFPDITQMKKALDYIKQNINKCNYTPLEESSCNMNGVKIKKRNIVNTEAKFLKYCDDAVQIDTTSCGANPLQNTIIIKDGNFGDDSYIVFYSGVNFTGQVVRRVKMGETVSINYNEVGSMKVVRGTEVMLSYPNPGVIGGTTTIGRKFLNYSVNDMYNWIEGLQLNKRFVSQIITMEVKRKGLKYNDEDVEACIMPTENFEGKPIPLYLNEPALLCVASNIGNSNITYSWKYKSLYAKRKLNFKVSLALNKPGYSDIKDATINKDIIVNIEKEYPFDISDLIVPQNVGQDNSFYIYITLVDESVKIIEKDRILPSPSMYDVSTNTFKPCLDTDYKSSNILECYPKDVVCRQFPDVGLTINSECLSLGIDPLKEGCTNIEEFAFRKEADCKSIGINPTLQFTCKKESSIFDPDIRNNCLELSNGTIDPCIINKDYAERMSFGVNRTPNACGDAVLAFCETDPAFANPYMQGAYSTNMYSRCYDAWNQGKIDFCKNPVFFDNNRLVCSRDCLYKPETQWTSTGGIERCKKTFPNPCNDGLYTITSEGERIVYMTPEGFRKKFTEVCIENGKLVSGIKHPCEEFPDFYYDQKEKCDAMGFNVCEKVPGYKIQFPDICKESICSYPSVTNIEKYLEQPSFQTEVLKFKNRILNERKAVGCKTDYSTGFREVCVQNAVTPQKQFGGSVPEVVDDPLTVYKSPGQFSWYASQIMKNMVITESGADKCRTKGIEMCNNEDFFDRGSCEGKVDGCKISKRYVRSNAKECKNDIKTLCNTNNVFKEEENKKGDYSLCGTCDNSNRVREVFLEECNYKACEDIGFLSFNEELCKDKYPGDICSLSAVKNNVTLAANLKCNDKIKDKCKDNTYWKENQICSYLGVDLEDTISKEMADIICKDPRGMKQEVTMFYADGRKENVTNYVWNDKIKEKCREYNIEPCKMPEYSSKNFEECSALGFKTCENENFVNTSEDRDNKRKYCNEKENIELCDNPIFLEKNKEYCADRGLGDCNDEKVLWLNRNGKCKTEFINKCDTDDNFYNSTKDGISMKLQCDSITEKQDCEYLTFDNAGCQQTNEGKWYKEKIRVYKEPKGKRAKQCPPESERVEDCAIDCVLDPSGIKEETQCLPENRYYSTGSDSKWYKSTHIKHLSEAQYGGKCEDDRKLEFCSPVDAGYTPWRSVFACRNMEEEKDFSENGPLTTTYVRQPEYSLPAKNGGKGWDTLIRDDKFNNLEECKTAFIENCKDANFLFQSDNNRNFCKAAGYEPCSNSDYVMNYPERCSTSDVFNLCSNNLSFLSSNSELCKNKGFDPCLSGIYAYAHKDECRSKGVEPCNNKDYLMLGYTVPECRDKGIEPCNIPEYYNKYNFDCDCKIGPTSECEQKEDGKWYKKFMTYNAKRGLGKCEIPKEECEPIDCKYSPEVYDEGCQQFEDGKWYKKIVKQVIQPPLYGGKECDTTSKGDLCPSRDCEVTEWRGDNCYLNEEKECMQNFYPTQFSLFNNGSELPTYGGKSCDPNKRKVEKCTRPDGIEYCNSMLPKDCVVTTWNLESKSNCYLQDDKCVSKEVYLPSGKDGPYNGGAECDMSQTKINMVDCDPSQCKVDGCMSRSPINPPNSQTDCPPGFTFDNETILQFNHDTGNQEIINSCIQTENDDLKCYTNENGNFIEEVSSEWYTPKKVSVRKQSNKRLMNCISTKPLNSAPLSQSDCPTGFKFEPDFAVNEEMTDDGNWKMTLGNSCVSTDSEDYVSCYSAKSYYQDPAYPNKQVFNYNYLVDDDTYKRFSKLDVMRTQNRQRVNPDINQTPTPTPTVVEEPFAYVPKSFLKFSDYNTYMRTMSIKL